MYIYIFYEYILTLRKFEIYTYTLHLENLIRNMKSKKFENCMYILSDISFSYKYINTVLLILILY